VDYLHIQYLLSQVGSTHHAFILIAKLLRTTG
jgi:hypothetical protein